MADAKTTTTTTKAKKVEIKVVALKYIKVDGVYRDKSEIFKMTDANFVADLEKRKLVSRIK